MYPFTRILTLAAAVALVGLIGASIPALAEESATQRHMPSPTTVDQADLNFQKTGECHLLRRAISRRACQARLWREMEIDTAENH